MKYLLRSFFFVLSLLLTSCKEEAAVEELAKPNLSLDGIYSYSLQFDAPYPHYDGENTTRATETGEWEDGDVVYIYLDTPNNAYAQATYSKTSNTWKLKSDKQFIEASSSICILWYGRSDNTSTGSLLSSAFLCSDGIYTYDASGVVIQAVLRPYGRRIRFINVDDQPISNCLTLWSPTMHFAPVISVTPNNKNVPFKKDPYGSSIDFWLNGTGVSNYAVYEIDEELRRLRLEYSWNGGNNGNYFERYFDDHTLFYGESGTLSIPTRANHRGWTLINSFGD